MEIKRVDIKFMIVVLAASLVLIVLSCLYFSGKPTVDKNELSKLNRNSDSLTLLNKTLLDSISKSKDVADMLKKRIDSVSSASGKIKIAYQTKYEKIKTLSANSISREFSIILADSNLYNR